MEVFLIPGALIGAYFLLWPRSHIRSMLQRRQERLDELNAGENEDYFEERRELEAYRPMKSEWLLRLLGGVMLAGCLIYLFTDR